jgi:hypothetical protein
MNEEQPIEQAPPPEAAPSDRKAPPEPGRNEPQAPDPRRRLRELLAIPDHQRTDAIWDEIIELEICLAPGNRIQPGAQQAEPGRRQQQAPGQGQGRRPEHPGGRIRRREPSLPSASSRSRSARPGLRPKV